MASSTPTIELEHAIGFSSIPGTMFYHPNNKDYIYITGGCIAVTEFDNAHNQTFLRGHDEDICCLAMSSSGSMLASGQKGENADVLLWSYDSKRLLYRLSEHDYGISTISFSHDEKLLLSIGLEADGKLYIWDMATGGIVATNQKFTGHVAASAWGGFVRDIKRRDTSNYQFVTVGNQHFCFWHLNPLNGEVSAHRIEGSTGLVRDFTCVQFSLDYENVYAASTTGDFVIINVKTHRVLKTISCCTGGVHSICVFQYGVLTGGGDGTLVYFDRTNVDVSQIKLHGKVICTSVSRDSVEALAGTSSGFVYRIQLDNQKSIMKALLQSENHSAHVAAVAYADASDKFATASWDGSIRIWDVSDYSVLTRCHIQDGGKPTSLAYSSDILLSGWSDGCIRCHTSDGGNFLWKIDNAHIGGVTAMILSKNQRFIVSGGEAGEVRVWDIRKRDLVSHLKEHTMKITDLAIFEDDIHVLSCSRDRSILCWDLQNERRISSHTQRMGGVNSIALSNDQTTVLSVGQERMVSYWDLRVESPVHVIQAAHNGEATCITVANNTKVFASGGVDQCIKLWDYETGLLLADGIGHSGNISSLCFSPDDKQLVSVGEDGAIFVWNMYT